MQMRTRNLAVAVLLAVTFHFPSIAAADSSGKAQDADATSKKMLAPCGQYCDPPPGTPSCVPNPTTACLIGGRYQVTSHWKNQYSNPPGLESTLNVTKRTDATAAFWLSDASTYEYLIRINTATDNGKAWISIPMFTDVEFWVLVKDVTTSQSFEYHSPAGNRTLIYDPFFFVYP
jgi:hypothetical protein